MIKKDAGVTRHYFDWAASAKTDIAVFDETFNGSLYGNPSSLHGEGRLAKRVLEEARQKCAGALNVAPECLFFTSGGTESNSIAIFSNLSRIGKGRTIASLAEHSSVREAIATVDRMGKPTGAIAVDSESRVTSGLFAKALEKYGDARFACCMAVNNETGAVTDMASLKNVTGGSDGAPVHLHCDLAQAAGKIPVDINAWEIDSASISAHKLGGPRGIGLLYLRRGSPSFGGAQIFYAGGGQENGVRGGTENVQGAAALASLLDKYAREENVKPEMERAKARMERLISSLLKINRAIIIPRSRPENQDTFSPYILQAAFRNIPGEVMARALDDLGFAVSTGSACSSASPERPVLEAMGIEEKLRIEGIRISQGYTTTDEEIDLLLDAITEVLKFL